MKFPRVIYTYAKGLMGLCPVCTSLDLKPTNDTYQRHAQCHIYRCSMTSVTMRCITCRLRFTITWKSFYTAIEQRWLLDPERKRHRYEAILRSLAVCVDIENSKRLVRTTQHKHKKSN